MVQKLVDVLALPSNEILKQIKDIPAQYRRTKKESPTKSSFFVGQILKPLQVFRDQWRSVLAENALRSVIIGVCENVTQR